MAKKKAARTRSRRKSGRRQRAKPVLLHEASRSKRTSVMRDLHKVLRKHNVAGRVAEFQLTAAAAPTPLGCPPGHIKRQVCYRNQNGQLVCVERCVPVSPIV